MAQILLTVTCTPSVGNPFTSTQTRRVWNTDTKRIETINTLFVSSCTPYSKPTNVLVDSYTHDEIYLRKVYHDGEGGVFFDDIIQLSIYPTYQPESLVPVLNPVAYKIKSTSGRSEYIYFAIFIEKEWGTMDYERIVGLKLHRGSGHEAVFYIQDFLRSYLKFYVPPLPVQNGSFAHGNSLRYLVNWGDSEVVSWGSGQDYVLLMTVSNTKATVSHEWLPETLEAGRYRVIVEKTPSIVFFLGMEGLTGHVARLNIPYIPTPDGKYECFVDIEEFADGVYVPGNSSIQIFTLEESGNQNLRYAYLGGFNYLQYPKITPSSNNFALTVAPDQRTVIRDQIEFLFILAAADDYYFTLPCTVYYTDGSTHILQPLTSLDVKKGQVIVFNINRPEAYTANPSKEIKHIRTTVGSKMIDLIPTKHNSPHIREFYFYNSRGGMDSLVTTGVGAEELVVEKEEIKKFVHYNYQPSDFEYDTIKTRAQSTFKVSSGFIETLEEYQAKREIFYSPKVFLRVKAGGVDMLAPIIITNSSTALTPDGNYLYSFDIEYKFAFDEKGVFNL